MAKMGKGLPVFHSPRPTREETVIARLHADAEQLSFPSPHARGNMMALQLGAVKPSFIPLATREEKRPSDHADRRSGRAFIPLAPREEKRQMYYRVNYSVTLSFPSPHARRNPRKDNEILQILHFHSPRPTRGETLKRQRKNFLIRKSGRKIISFIPLAPREEKPRYL